MAKKLGRFTYVMENKPSILSYGSVVSKKEGEGPLAPYFDVINQDSSFGEKTWEKAESQMEKEAVEKAMEKIDITPKKIDMVFAGDLLNQCIGSTFGMKGFSIPHIGVYGACSTMAETMALGSIMVDSATAKHIIAVTSSHFCTAERQYRFPLEYGGQRPPTTQWTVTGAGAVIIGQGNTAPYIKAVSFGVIEDKGIKDANNMGGAMAPAAATTIKNYFIDTNTTAEDFDVILTGDLGQIGSDVLVELLKRDGYDISKKHQDCGLLIYDRERQDVHAGGSGCGCSAVVLTSFILPSMRAGRIKRLLFIATGALLSPTSVQQGEAIPCIAHLLDIEGE